MNATVSTARHVDVVGTAAGATAGRRQQVAPTPSTDTTSTQHESTCENLP